MDFIYVALAKNGELKKGVLRAENKSEAQAVLESLGLKPVKIKKRIKILLLGQREKVKRKELILFTMQLHSVITSGIPLTTGLDSIKEEMGNKYFRKVIDEIKLSLLEGKTLYEAFSFHKKVFPMVYLGALKVGEESGTLPKTLERLIQFLTKQEEFISQVTHALIYPAFAITTIVFAAIFYIVYVLPKVLELVMSLNVKLPFITILLINFVKFLKTYGIAFLCIAVAVLFILFLMRKSSRYRIIFDKIVLKTPLVSRILGRSLYAQFSTFLAIMLEAGVDLSTSLALLLETMSNTVFKKKIHQIKELVEGGTSLGGAFRLLYFPPLFVSMVEVGEETGRLPAQLHNLGNYYERELENMVRRLQATIEPVLIITIGVFAAFIFVSILLPIYQTISTLR